MKKQLLISMIVFVSANVFSQGGSDNWKTNGNTPQAGSFFGTVSNFGINFRVNNVQKMVLDPIGDLQLSNLAGPGNRILMSDANGKLLSLPAGNAGQFLQGDGTWGNLPGGATSWQLIAGNLISTNTGNIGIGTSNPQNKLEVVGNVSISNNLFVGGGLITSQQVDATTMLNAGDVNATNNLNVQGNSNFSGSMISPQLGNGNGYQPVYVTPAGQLVTGGLMGPIGPMFPSTSCYPFNDPWRIGGNTLIGAGFTDPSIGTCDDMPFGIKQNNQARVYFANSGLQYNIGFGTTSPQQKYHFSSGNMLIDASNSPDGFPYTKLSIQGGLDNTGLSVSTNHTPGSGNYNTLLITNDNDTKALTVRNNGLENFTVYGNGKTNITTIGSPGLEVSTTNGPSGYNTKLKVNLNETKALVISNTFANPNGFENFIVNGAGKTNIGFQPNATNIAMLNVNVNGGNAINVYDAITNDINFSVKSTGIVYSREIFVQTGNFPDYVFAKDYKLLSLDKLKKYISDNNHLPNMPTANDVKTNGMNLGELSRVQVEKIEELTLYVIALKEELELLKKEISKNKNNEK